MTITVVRWIAVVLYFILAIGHCGFAASKYRDRINGKLVQPDYWGSINIAILCILIGLQTILDLVG